MTIGHQRQIKYLKRVLERGTLAHAYLFHGPEAVGKKTAALALAKSLLCRNNQGVGLGAPKPSSTAGVPAVSASLGSCGQCGDCRQTETMKHPDLIFLSLERMLVEEDNKREIGIKNIHELQRILGLSAWGGGWRIAVIDGAEHLSREAQSALLKILEEPSSRTAFFLVAANTEALLPTIRSRCVGMSFGTIADDEMMACLEGISASRPGRASPQEAGRHSLFLTLAQGRPGMLIRLIRDKTFLDDIRSRRERFEKLLRLNLSEQFSFSEKEAREPAVLESFLEFLLRKFYQDFHPVRGKPPLAAAAPSARASNGVHQVLGTAPRPNFAEQNLGGLPEFLKILLEKLAIVQFTAVNRRLLADSVFFEYHMLDGIKPA